MDLSKLFAAAHANARSIQREDARTVAELEDKTLSARSPRVRRIAEQKLGAARARAARSYRERFAQGLRRAYLLGQGEPETPTDKQVRFMRDLGHTGSVDGMSVEAASAEISRLIRARDARRATSRPASRGYLHPTDFNLPDPDMMEWEHRAA